MGEALTLYRALLRGARQMPTTKRRQFVEQRVRASFRQMQTETNAEEIAQALQLGWTHLDTIHVQAQHLSRLFLAPKQP